jgi:hypothetical protein
MNNLIPHREIKGKSNNGRGGKKCYCCYPFTRKDFKDNGRVTRQRLKRELNKEKSEWEAYHNTGG